MPIGRESARSEPTNQLWEVWVWSLRVRISKMVNYCVGRAKSGETPRNAPIVVLTCKSGVHHKHQPLPWIKSTLKIARYPLVIQGFSNFFKGCFKWLWQTPKSLVIREVLLAEDQSNHLVGDGSIGFPPPKPHVSRMICTSVPLFSLVSSSSACFEWRQKGPKAVCPRAALHTSGCFNAWSGILLSWADSWAETGAPKDIFFYQPSKSKI